ncbi:ATP-grasp domain-containing protein [Sulfurimonas sp.]|nr:ATP-grasp domain-containing protein [Sulfurimonas sp.]
MRKPYTYFGHEFGYLPNKDASSFPPTNKVIMKIEIITTPNEELKETGFGSIKACKNVLHSINNMGHTVELTICKSLQDLKDVVQRKPDLVILAVKYIVLNDIENIWLSEYFAKNGINHSGSSRETLKYDSDKVLAKSFLRNKGINTAKYFTAIPGEYKSTFDLPTGYPLFIKPLNAANGNGIDDLSLVNNFEEFQSKVLSLYESYDAPVLVEEYISGQEFTVAIIQTKDDGLIVSALEIIAPESSNGLRILGEKVKRDDTEVLRKTKDNLMMDRVKTLAIDAYIELGIRDYGRIDVKTNKYGHCFFMEVNLVPGMGNGSSYFPIACALEHNLSYYDVIKLIVDKGISRVPSNIPLQKPLLIDSVELAPVI